MIINNWVSISTMSINNIREFLRVSIIPIVSMYLLNNVANNNDLIKIYEAKKIKIKRNFLPRNVMFQYFTTLICVS